MRNSVWAMAAAAMLLGAVPLHAESSLSVHSALFVERDEAVAGRAARLIEPARTLSRGQRVVLILDWRGAKGDRPVTVTTPIPARLAFERSSNGTEEISADGGRSWGRLGRLRLRDAEGVRLARLQDVTHVRWTIARGKESGRITFSAMVR